MLDRYADGLGAWVMIGFWKQPFDFGRLIGKPITLSACGNGIRCRNRAFSLFGNRPRSICTGRAAEINAEECAALSFDEARDCAAATARIFDAITWDLARGQGGRIHLHNMEAWDNALKMIAALDIGNGIASVLKHDADTGNAIGDVWIDCAAAIGDPANDRHPVANPITGDTDGGIDDWTLCTAIIACARPVHCCAGAGIRTDFGNIGEGA